MNPRPRDEANGTRGYINLSYAIRPVIITNNYKFLGLTRPNLSVCKTLLLRACLATSQPLLPHKDRCVLTISRTKNALSTLGHRQDTNVHGITCWLLKTMTACQTTRKAFPEEHFISFQKILNLSKNSFSISTKRFTFSETFFYPVFFVVFICGLCS